MKQPPAYPILPKRRTIAMLAFDGAELLDICGPLDTFYYVERWLQYLERMPESAYAK